MAEDRQVTPEKQLLKLIEESGGAAPKGPAAQKARIRHAGPAIFSLASLRGAASGWFSSFKRAFQPRGGKRKPALSFKTANRFLITASVILTFYLVADTFALAVSLMRPPNFVMQPEKEAAVSADSLPGLEDESVYIEKAASRNLFKGGRSASSKKSEKAGKEESAQNAAASALSLVGISWSSSPDAIIEDKNKQRTYFLKRGMSFGDGMRVTAIFKDKVLISAGGEEFEIK